MPRLQILQHKSYHPYLETNKQRVRDDEAKAAALEAEEERAALDQNSASRLTYLRNKDALPPPTRSARLLDSGTDSSALLAARRSEKIRADKRDEKRRLEYGWPQEERKKSDGRGKEVNQGETLEGSGDKGHINFWAGLEKPSTAKPKRTPDQIQADDPTTMYLSRPLRETRPWYTDAELRTHDDRDDEDVEKRERRERRRRKDESFKNAQDPMTLVQAALSSSSSSSRHQLQNLQRYPHPAAGRARSPPRVGEGDDSRLRAARAARESTERARALALVQAAARREGVTKTPMTNTTDGFDSVRGEGDLWNAQEVREARKRKEAVRGWRSGVAGERRTSR